MSEQTDIQSRMNHQDDPASGGNIGSGGGGGAEDIVEALSETDSGLVLAEERKPLNRSTIVTFVVLVLGAGGVWYMYQRAGGPDKAAAASKETQQAKQTIDSFLSGGDASIKLMESMLLNTQRVVQQFLNYPSMTQIPLSDLKTNPFRLTPDDPNSDASQLGEKRRREEERLAALKAVQGLQLQSIMYGDSRRACMINGALYVEGQDVENFNVEKINPQSVVVQTGPYRFELRMQR